MKKVLVFSIIAVSLSLIFLLPIVNAQETENPGITPDSPFWGIDRAFEQLSLFLTTNPEAKSIKGLKIASERLAEIKIMIEENKLKAAGKAQESHGKILIKVEKNINEIEEDNSTEEIKKIIEIEKELEDHNEEVEQAFGELKIKIKIEGKLTKEQKDLIDSILASLEGQTGKIEIEIKNKKNEVKIKIKQETGKNDQEIEDEIEKFEIGAGMRTKVRAKIVGDQSEVKIDMKFYTTTTNKTAIIQEIINNFTLDRELADIALKIEAEEDEEELEEQFKVDIKVKDGVTKVRVKLKFISNTTDREEILNAIVEKSQLTTEQIENVVKFRDKDKEKEEKELEIEVEIEEGVAEVEVELGKEEFEFTLETTDRETIISEIIERTGLTKEEIESVIKFEEKENHKNEAEEEEEVEIEEENNESVEEENSESTE